MLNSTICPELRGRADQAVSLNESGRKFVSMAGPAGCGKTEAIKYIVNTYPGKVCVAAYMGQAARMLQQRGIEVTTIHRLVFYPLNKRREEMARITAEITRFEVLGGHRKQIDELHARLEVLIQPGFVINEESELAQAAFCIIDEASMVGPQLGGVLESFGRPILAVGDPYQLHPVDGDIHFDLSDPDVALERVYRQAEGNGRYGNRNPDPAEGPAALCGSQLPLP